jgi:GT2 family glycosyltransferase
MLEYMDAHPETMAMQPKVISWHSKQAMEQGNASALSFEHAGAAGGMMDLLGYPYCRGRMMGWIEEDHGQYDSVMPIFWATGACMLTRTRIYKDLGGLDANFFAHQEEIDLCWRMHNWANGAMNIVCLPLSVVYHVGGGTLGYENPRKTFLNFRNNLLMLYKNLPKKHRCWILFVRFWMDYLAALQMLLTGQWENVKAVVQARLAYHKMKRGYQVTNYEKQNGYSLLVRRSIVWDFYVRRKKS